jgi:hypothetical protein
VCGSEVEDESEGSTQSDSSEEDNDLRWHETAKGPDVPSEYWHIQKLIKYMKVGQVFIIWILRSGLVSCVLFKRGPSFRCRPVDANVNMCSSVEVWR